MEKILTVDDSISIRKMISNILSEKGYDVFQAANGKQALEIIKQNKFDLILLDFNLPDTDGITLATELRTIAEYKFIPIVIVTTEPSQKIKQRAQAASITGWVKKPLNSERLLQIIKRVFD